MTRSEFSESQDKGKKVESDNLGDYRSPGRADKPPTGESGKKAEAQAVKQKHDSPQDGASRAGERFINESVHLDAQFRFGFLNSEPSAELIAIRKRMEDSISQKILEIKRFTNQHGKDPASVLGNALNDPTKVSFWGEFHSHGTGNPDYEEFRQALEQAHPVDIITPEGPKTVTAIMAPELPDAFQPLFARYNNTPPETKFTVPEDLDHLLGEKAAKFFRHNQAVYSESFQLYEAAHKKGIRIIPYDDPAVMSILEAPNIDVAANAFNEGGDKNPAREEYMKNKLLSIIKKYPNSPIIVAGPCGDNHVRENNNSAYNPVSELLAHDPEFINRNKEVVSFATFSTDIPILAQGLAPITDGLKRPVCISTKEVGLPELLSNVKVYPGERESPAYKDFDFVIFRPREKSNDLPVPSKILPDIQLARDTSVKAQTSTALSEPFFRMQVTEQEKWDLGELFNIGALTGEIGKLYASKNTVDHKGIANFLHAINEVGAQPNATMKEILKKPGSVVFIDDLNNPSEYLTRKPETVKIRAILADVIPGSPPGSCLMVDMPSVMKPVIDRFNQSPKGTKISQFVKADQGFQELIKDKGLEELVWESDSLSAISEQVYESAHNSGIEIIPFGTNYHPEISEKALKQLPTEMDAYRQKIFEQCANRPDASVIVWHTRALYSPQVEQALTSDQRFQALDKHVDRIGFVGPIHKGMTVSPLCESLEKPVCLDLKDPRLSNLSSNPTLYLARYLDPNKSYTEFLHQHRTYGKVYDHLIMIPVQKNE